MIETTRARLRGQLAGEVRRDTPLAALTTYAVGGPADILVEPRDAHDVQVALEVCRELGVPVTVIGAGSNLLVADEGIRGVVLRVADCLDSIDIDDDILTVGAGRTDGTLADTVAEAGIDGFAFLADLPGAVGGAIVMNAGNNDGEVADVLLDVTWVDSSGRRRTTLAAECELDYRHSVFRDIDAVLVGARFRADRRAAPASLRERNAAIREARAGKFPTERANCGSVFKRPTGDYAGRLIQAAGCKGLQVGRAQVSHKHAGFIVNLGGAKAADIRALIEEVQRRVEDHAGVRLEREVIYLGP